MFQEYRKEIDWGGRPLVLESGKMCTSNSIIAEMADRGIWIRDDISGKLLRKVPMSAIECLVQVGDDLVFAGPRHRAYFLFSLPEFDVVHRMPSSQLNPDASLSFVILGVLREGEELVVHGWEQYPGGNINSG